jgi:putative phosphoesterase
LKVAALYDIHGMADALAAVLAEVEREGVDTIVVGGDVVAGPEPAETMALLRRAGVPLHWVRGNGDRAVGEGDPTATGADAETLAFTVARLDLADREFLAALPERFELDVQGLGPVLFCHGTPGSDIELVTPETPEWVLRRALEGFATPVVVCGHTHMQFERRVDGTRWVNAGSVGMPFQGDVAAFWALIGPDVELRRTLFDTDSAERAILASGWPEAEEFVAEHLRQAVPRADAIAHFERVATERGER